MPKMKTKKAIVKRVKVSASGKVFRHKAGGGHLKSRKSPSRLRRFRKGLEVTGPFAKQIKRMLGH
jgi:large subunit ribosomal protein L35